MNDLYSGKRYHTLDCFFKNKFGCKIAKIPLSGNFSCPNRDGTKSTGGCIYCSGALSGDFAGKPEDSIEKQFSEIADMMAKEGVFFDYGDNARLPGKMQFHYRLAFDENDIPMMYVFSTCKNFIRTIPNLIYDSSNVEDIDTTTEDHIYDAVRYVLMSNPINPRPPKNIDKKSYNPLDDEDYNLSRYEFYIN